MWRATCFSIVYWILENTDPFTGNSICALTKSRWCTCLCSSVSLFHFPPFYFICLGMGQYHTGPRVTSRRLGIRLSMFSTRIAGHPLFFVFYTKFKMSSSVSAKTLLKFWLESHCMHMPILGELIIWQYWMSQDRNKVYTFYTLLNL